MPFELVLLDERGDLRDALRVEVLFDALLLPRELLLRGFELRALVLPRLELLERLPLVDLLVLALRCLVVDRVV